MSPAHCPTTSAHRTPTCHLTMYPYWAFAPESSVLTSCSAVLFATSGSARPAPGPPFRLDPSFRGNKQAALNHACCLGKRVFLRAFRPTSRGIRSPQVQDETHRLKGHRPYGIFPHQLLALSIIPDLAMAFPACFSRLNITYFFSSQVLNTTRALPNPESVPGSRETLSE